MIEDSLKDAATVERSFSLLKCAGIFERISGLILGKHEKFDDMGTGRQPYEILQEVMGDVDFPVLAEFDCCHTHHAYGAHRRKGPAGCRRADGHAAGGIALQPRFAALRLYIFLYQNHDLCNVFVWG